MNKTLLSIATVSAAFSLQAGGFAGIGEKVTFKTYQTCGTGAIKEVKTTPFTRHQYGQHPVIDLDAFKPSHKYLGLGISFTDASCWLISQLPAEKRAELLKEIFTAKGLGLSVGRLNVGSSDYATELYNYNDNEGDVEMKKFSVARDEAYLIPLLKETMSVCPDMYFFASPWSAPGWMKTSGRMCGGQLKDECFEALANYLVAYVKAYRQRGVKVRALTLQNEPRTEQDWGCPAMRVTGEQEAAVVGRFLGPKLKAAGLDTKVWLWDHNCKDDDIERVLRVMGDPKVAEVTKSVAVHPYEGWAGNLKKIRDAHPKAAIHMTEDGPVVWQDNPGDPNRWLDEICDWLGNGCSSFSGWNLALDPDGQPCTGHFSCGGLVEIDLEKASWRRSAQYYAFRHVGPFAKRGADIMERQDANFHKCMYMVFRNPDGSFVIPISHRNEGHDRRTVQIKYKGLYLAISLPVCTDSMTTVVIDK